MADNLEPRESMEFDVVIVGGGPSGLAAAIRLKQLDENINVVVLEKGAEIGAHILSGAVIDPIAVDRLFPDWRDEEKHPFNVPVKKDKFYLMGEGGQVAPARICYATADEQSRKLHRLARQCVPLDGRESRSARRRSVPRFRSR